MREGLVRAAGRSGRAIALMSIAGLAVAVSGVSAQSNLAGSDPEPTFAPGSIVMDSRTAIRNDEILLGSGRVRMPLMSKQAIGRVVDRASAGERHVVQLNGPMTTERRAALEGAGVSLGDYLPANTWIARVDGADGGALGELSFVRSVGEFSGAWKIEASLEQRTFQSDERIKLQQAGRSLLSVTLFDGAAPKDIQNELDAIGGVVVHRTHQIAKNEVLTIEMDSADVGLLSVLDSVQYIEHEPEIMLRNSTTRWIVQSNIASNFPLYDEGLHGEGQVIGVLDGPVDQAHCSFPAGKIIAYNNPPAADFHGTHVAATAAGDAGAENDTRGNAYLANLVVNTTPAFTEAAIRQRLDLHHGQGARVHTNSWGDDGTTSYNSLARGFDSWLYDNEESFVCLAATNTATLRNPENAKNLLACGGTNDTPSQANFCTGGIGPTSDGRRKPELFAPGCGILSAAAGSGCGTASASGTSMATPAISGVAAMTRQYFVDGYYPSGAPVGSDSFTPSGALIKATLLNSSVDMTGVAGFPSNQEGWGRVLADNALHFTGETRKLFVEDVFNANGLSTNDEIVIPVAVLGAGEELRVTLVWTDPPAAAGASFAAINDLDLEVQAPSGLTYLGNVFSAGQSDTGGSKDDRNNVEQVSRLTPEVGTWIITIKAPAVNQGLQGYSLAVSGDIIGGVGDIPLTLSASGPSIVLPGSSIDVTATINENDDTLVGGSALLHYRLDGGAFQSVSLTNVGGSDWEGSIPFVDCPDTPEWYVAAEGTTTGVVTSPFLGASSPNSVIVGEFIELLSEDFEAPGPMSWSVSTTATAGAWEAGVPVNDSRGDPPTDFDGSGQCFLTENDPLDSNSDVDAGCTELTSPAFDVSGGGTINYAYWIDSGPGSLVDDFLQIEIATDDPPTNWAVVRTYTSASPAWQTDALDLPGDASPSATVRLRITACDNGAASLIECGFDALLIEDFQCTPVGGPDCEGDVDGNGVVDVADVGYAIFRLGNTGAPGSVDGDADGSGTVDVNDLSFIIFRFGPCPS